MDRNRIGSRVSVNEFLFRRSSAGQHGGQAVDRL
jgi:hypothetical protein